MPITAKPTEPQVEASMAVSSGSFQLPSAPTGLKCPDKRPHQHKVVHTASQDAVVVYIDNDPLVVQEAAEILRRRGEKNVTYISGDIRDPTGILDHPEVKRLIDF